MYNKVKKEYSELVYDKFLDIKELLDDMPPERAIETMLFILILKKENMLGDILF